MRWRFAALLLISWCLPSWGQGPMSGFMNAGGHTDVAVSYATESYRNYRLGTALQRRPNTILSYSLFLEHSVSDRFSLVASVPYLQLAPNNRGLQDGIFGFKFRNRYRQADSYQLNGITSLALSLPLSNYSTGMEDAIGQRALIFQGRMIRQWLFSNGFFVGYKTGIDFMLAPQAQLAVPLLLRTGFGSEQFFTEFWLEWYHTFNTVDLQQAVAGTGSSWQRLGWSIYKPVLPNVGVVGGVAVFLGGRNIGLGKRFHFGIVYRLD